MTMHDPLNVKRYYCL